MEDLNLLSDLPPSLATRLALMRHHRLMVKGAHFFSALSDNAMLAVLERLRPVVFIPNEVIVMEGQLLKAVHFVQKGQVRLSSEAEPEGRIVEVGDSFGLEVVESIIERETSSSGSFNGSFSSLGASSFGDAINPSAFGNAYAEGSAHAVTYCEVMSLALQALAELLARESSWANLITKKAPAAKSRFKRVSNFLRTSQVCGRRSQTHEQAGRGSMAGEHDAAGQIVSTV